MNQEKILTDLTTQGWYYCENYMAHNLCHNLLRDLSSLMLKPARVGKSGAEQTQKAIRNDSIYWLAPNISKAQDQYLSEMNKLMRLFNREFYLGLKQFEGHFARYEKSGFYKKHLDQFVGNQERLVSVITYLNSPAAGGELRVYNKENAQKVDIDISPKIGSLVCFLSSQIYHEVLPTQNERLSITGWLRTTIL